MRFSNLKNRKIYIFYAFTVKTDFGNASENGGLDGKTEENRLKVATLPSFFKKKKKHSVSWKTENTNQF